jgi:hypothetical protein
MFEVVLSMKRAGKLFYKKKIWLLSLKCVKGATFLMGIVEYG